MPLSSPPEPPVLRAVLFDLDDTLFDHEWCAREALAAVHRAHDAFRSTTFEDFERAHASHLEELHKRVLAGEIDIDAARVERFRRLFADARDDCVDAPGRAARLYRESYMRGRRAVAGAVDLLRRLRPTVRIGVVSNNLLAEQQEKLQQCGLSGLVDVLVVSEEAGAVKPDPEIFRVALRRLAVSGEDVVMVGDSWSADILGARAAGITPIWFNRRGRPRPENEVDVPELRSLAPADRVVDFILRTHRSASADRR